ncbi:hypothetical protein PSHT_02587 [Puccinia striiformis]|uniref:No apical meristem-associated C-terminal domain-containing protein n=1 Tax=Puccinia striiformis TaxID=27350 RepID=A0A2S4WHI8_9BASI|nr:hypothetical protein PSHT_02587 [Puccinia striiformis]
MIDPTLATRTPSPQPTPANEEKTNDPIKETKAANCVPKKKREETVKQSMNPKNRKTSTTQTKRRRKTQKIQTGVPRKIGSYVSLGSTQARTPTLELGRKPLKQKSYSEQIWVLHSPSITVGSFFIIHQSGKKLWTLAARLKKEKRPPSSLPASEGISVKTNEGNEEDNQTDSESLGSSRPEGQKAAKKRKFKETRAPEAQKELIKISREKMAAMQTVADDVIMSKDLSAMDPISRAFYTAKKEEIAKRIGLRLSDS